MAKRTQKPARPKPPTTPPRSTRNIRSSKPAKPTGQHPIELIARGLWLHGSHVLLCRNLDKNYLYLPGGHIEFGESAAAALEREFLEEAGQRITAGELVLVTEGIFQTRKRWHHEINLTFACGTALPGGDSLRSPKPPTIRSQEKHIAFEWIDLAAAVDLDIRPLAVKAWLAAGATTDRGPEWVSEIPRP